MIRIIGTMRRMPCTAWIAAAVWSMVSTTARAWSRRSLRSSSGRLASPNTSGTPALRWWAMSWALFSMAT
ncbi:MAG: hypothetical protein BWZ09_02603 [Alphaproteobacteria bacterium ADurb.BinA305]|nr:MAG: hypothetical protein BWZ09_02603 [Alphaproteobacteria bacterium ADurb.BinA305]